MHISPTSADVSILNGDKNDLAKLLLRRLNPDKWPLRIDQLPLGTALVGGAVRDGLLNRLQEKPDLDLVVPNNAIKITQNFAKSLGSTSIVLDAERDMARLVFQGWTIDFATQIGCSLEEDLWRRDFRLNAIALLLGPNPKIVDPTARRLPSPAPGPMLPINKGTIATNVLKLVMIIALNLLLQASKAAL